MRLTCLCNFHSSVLACWTAGTFCLCQRVVPICEFRESHAVCHCFVLEINCHFLFLSCSWLQELWTKTSYLELSFHGPGKIELSSFCGSVGAWILCGTRRQVWRDIPRLPRQVNFCCGVSMLWLISLCLFFASHEKVHFGLLQNSRGSITREGRSVVFLAGDPCRFHAFFIAVVLASDDEVTSEETASLSRLGATVRKTVLLCSEDKDRNLTYLSLQWTGVSWSHGCLVRILAQIWRTRERIGEPSNTTTRHWIQGARVRCCILLSCKWPWSTMPPRRTRSCLPLLLEKRPVFVSFFRPSGRSCTCRRRETPTPRSDPLSNNDQYGSQWEIYLL